ncbi:MAG: ATP phosphoribosyltransferase regulatory subunit [Spirochaetales bacterium]|nr:ATP phosphoribosyltransferase regulatory subunit [Spirochaetales bacterium]
MNTRNPGLLSLTAGSEGIVLQDGELHRFLVSKLDTLFHSWGYTPVHTPMADYADDYAETVGVSVPPYTYRFVDREGQILSLRSDITLFLVKQIHHLLKSAVLPLRMCYSDSIVRYQDAIDIGKNEFFQSGAELLGVSGRDGDLEILVLLARVLESLDLPNPVIHVGSRELFDQLWSDKNQHDKEEARKALSMREFRTLSKEDQQTARLFSFIGNTAEFRNYATSWSSHISKQAQVALDELIDRAATLESLVPVIEVRIDLSELGSQGYHSGIVFSAYLPGADSSIASGGRYDRLLKNLELEVPAIGFSLMTSKVASLLSPSTQLGDYHELANRENFEKRYHQAEALRAQGKKVRL